ncbi:RNase H domain-containing protein [Trichonephila clavipes]|nr:RNase H domain-containing protein [Trichonephila clavipes]
MTSQGLSIFDGIAVSRFGDEPLLEEYNVPDGKYCEMMFSGLAFFLWVAGALSHNTWYIRHENLLHHSGSELIDINGALDHALNSYKDSIWILTDSRSSIQYLKNSPKIMVSAGLDILSKLLWLGQRKQVCFQWIPSHVGVPGNETADELAAKRHGLSIQCRSSRAHQTALARLKSGHLRSMTFVYGVKSFFYLPCSLLASPVHLLDCWGISLRQLYEEQNLVSETITRKGQTDLVKAILLQGDWKQQQQQKS